MNCRHHNSYNPRSSTERRNFSLYLTIGLGAGTVPAMRRICAAFAIIVLLALPIQVLALGLGVDCCNGEMCPMHTSQPDSGQKSPCHDSHHQNTCVCRSHHFQDGVVQFAPEAVLWVSTVLTPPQTSSTVLLIAPPVLSSQSISPPEQPPRL